MASASALSPPSTTNAGPDNSEPDPSIAGPGVLFGFIFSGLITFIASLFLIWIQRLPEMVNKSKLLCRLTPQPPPGKERGPAEFWAKAMEDFVLQLSDQQIVTSLLLLICAMARYWTSSVRQGSDNLWTAADVVIFSSITHAATLIPLRSRFYKHFYVIIIRVIVMYVVFILWIIIGTKELDPRKPMDSVKKTAALADFWHGTTVIEGLCTPLLYLAACLPLFASDQAIDARRVISHNHEPDFDIVKKWIRDKEEQRPAGLHTNGTWHLWGTCAVISHFFDHIGARFAHAFVSCRTTRGRLALWAIAEILWPCYIAQILLGAMWLYSLVALTISLATSGIASMTWDFGQLLPAVLIVLPLQSLVSSIAAVMDEEKEDGKHSDLSAKSRKSVYPETFLRPPSDVVESGLGSSIVWKKVEIDSVEVSIRRIDG